MDRWADRAPLGAGRSVADRDRFPIRGLPPDGVHRGGRIAPTGAAGSVASRGYWQQARARLGWEWSLNDADVIDDAKVWTSAMFITFR